MPKFLPQEMWLSKVRDACLIASNKLESNPPLDNSLVWDICPTGTFGNGIVQKCSAKVEQAILSQRKQVSDLSDC